ncbi:MAG TPA: hypothetical protein VM841_04265 [Actinomycetota bacterium]|nr:hypothetical protein [Actinomycetota bacterium]
MTRLRATLAVAALFATLLAPVQSRAGRTIDIEVFAAVISPRQLVAQKGDLIRFTFTDGHFKLVTHASADFDDDPATDPTLINSPDVRVTRSQPPVVYVTEFQGGTIWYRNLHNSKLDENNNVCSGMCASITSIETMPSPPVITVPAAPVREKPASISGKADPLTLITLAEGTTVETGDYKGQALADEYGDWTVKTVNFGDTGGNKRLIARSVDARGYVSADSQVAVVQYLPDFEPPEIVFDAPPLPVFFSEFEFTGTARDNVKVRAIAVQFIYLSPNTGSPTNQNNTVLLPAVCNGCGTSNSVTWSFKKPVIGTFGAAGGLYQVTAFAWDTFDRRASADAPSILGSGRLVLLASGTTVPDPTSTASPTPTPSISTPPLP